MKNILLLLFIVSFHKNIAQIEFQRTFGGLKKDNSFHIIETKDNGFLSIGSTESFGSGKNDIYLIKMDNSGNLLWSKTYGGPANDYGRYIDKTTDGNFIIVGHSLSYSKEFNDICLIKVNDSGEILWSKSYGLDKSDYSCSVQTTRDGGFVILGETINFINNEKNSDILVIRTDKMGKVQWSKVYGGNNTDYGYSIEETKDGGFIIGGETNSYGAGEWDFYLLKLKQDGVVDWSKVFGESKTDYGRYASETSDGGYMIGGNTYNFKCQDSDICIAKTNSKGEVEWAKTYGGSETDYLLCLKALDNNKVAFTGYTNSYGLMVEDAFLMIVNETGKPLLAKAYGSQWNDYGVSLTETTDEGIIVAGSTKSFGSAEDDIFIIKTNPTWKTKTCNMTYLHPINIKNVLLKVGSGHYEIELHCPETNIDVIVTNAITAEQVICPPLPKEEE